MTDREEKILLDYQCTPVRTAGIVLRKFMAKHRNFSYQVKENTLL